MLITNTAASADRYDAGLAVPRVVLGVDVNEATISSDGVLRHLARVLRLLARTRKAIRQQRVDTVLSFLTTANLLAVLATRGLRIRVVISERNDTTRQEHPLAVRVARGLLYRFADTVTANSRAALLDMRRYVPEHKLRLVANPVTIPSTPAEPDRSCEVLTVGRLVQHKQHALIIEAFAQATVRSPAWTLKVLGAGPEHGRLTNVATRIGVADRVIFSGFVTDPVASYRDAAIYVLASRYEGMPNSLMEAMAAGLACVVPDDIPGAVDLVQDGVTGLIFRGGDAADLARSLHRLIEDPRLRARMGASARETMGRYTPNRVLKRWEELLS